MSLNLQLPEKTVLKPKIAVFGVGGAGGNAVNNMIMSDLKGVSFIVANTDAQSLDNSLAEQKIQLGEVATKGLGAGSMPEVGKEAAEESAEKIKERLEGANMIFITAGMGGGTGTGAAPVIAKIAKEMSILTVGVVTKPFYFEGARRMKVAEEGLGLLQQFVDTLIIIPNQNLFRVANENTTFADAFKMADDVLHSGVRGVTDLMVMPGLINLDFADIKTIMREMGKAMMGTGQSEGEKRAIEAAEAAISNPLLDNVSMKGAKGVLISITGGSDLTLFEVDEAANRIREEVDGDANIIFGSTFDENMEGMIRVSVVATGIESETFRKAVQQQTTAKHPQQNQQQNTPGFTTQTQQYPNSQPAIATKQYENNNSTINIPEENRPQATTPPANSNQQKSQQQAGQYPQQQNRPGNYLNVHDDQIGKDELYTRLRSELTGEFNQESMNKEYLDVIKRLNQEYNENIIPKSENWAGQESNEGQTAFMAPKASSPNNEDESSDNTSGSYGTSNKTTSYEQNKKEVASRGLFKRMAQVAKSWQSSSTQENNIKKPEDTEKQKVKTSNVPQETANKVPNYNTSPAYQDENDELLDVPAFLRRKA